MAEQPNQIPRRGFPGMSPEFLQHYYSLIDAVNGLQGRNGPVTINDHLSLSGNRVTNIGAPVEPTDAISSGHAQANYSASALAPQLEIGGAYALNSYRALNSRSQQENYSSFLKGTVSGPGSSTTINPTATTSGGNTTITLPASTFQFADGTTKAYPARTDTVANPAAYTISVWVVGSPQIASITTTATNTVVMGGTVTIAGSGGIDGTWVVLSIISPTVFTVAVPNGSGSGSGGTVTTSGVFYYYAVKGNPILQLSGVPQASDTPYVRLPVSNDSRQLVAVITINNSGANISASAGGGTPTNAANGGSFF